MLYCVTVFVVVKTKDKKKLKMDIPCQLGSPSFFFSLKCLVKPHRIGYVSSSQGCCSPFPFNTATAYLLLGPGKELLYFFRFIPPA